MNRRMRILDTMNAHVINIAQHMFVSSYKTWNTFFSHNWNFLDIPEPLAELTNYYIRDQMVRNHDLAILIQTQSQNTYTYEYMFTQVVKRTCTRACNNIYHAFRNHSLLELSQPTRPLESIDELQCLIVFETNTI